MGRVLFLSERKKYLVLFYKVGEYFCSFHTGLYSYNYYNSSHAISQKNEKTTDQWSEVSDYRPSFTSQTGRISELHMMRCSVCSVYTGVHEEVLPKPNKCKKKQKTKKQKHVLPQTRARYTIQGSLTHTDRKENSKTVSQPVGKSDTD